MRSFQDASWKESGEGKEGALHPAHYKEIPAALGQNEKSRKKKKLGKSDDEPHMMMKGNEGHELATLGIHLSHKKQPGLSREN